MRRYDDNVYDKYMKSLNHFYTCDYEVYCNVCQQVIYECNENALNLAITGIRDYVSFKHYSYGCLQYAVNTEEQ